ncbi:flocculation protein FLO11-like, partial [Amphibalanus amphitrite]|uniref:flocculation protein FLO11-like n=1 Tax=Amphibalanus amphitrite TaxID=1232801 RepID=UPI001C917EB1
MQPFIDFGNKLQPEVSSGIEDKPSTEPDVTSDTLKVPTEKPASERPDVTTEPLKLTTESLQVLANIPETTTESPEVTSSTPEVTSSALEMTQEQTTDDKKERGRGQSARARLLLEQRRQSARTLSSGTRSTTLESRTVGDENSAKNPEEQDPDTNGKHALEESDKLQQTRFVGRERSSPRARTSESKESNSSVFTENETDEERSTSEETGTHPTISKSSTHGTFRHEHATTVSNDSQTTKEARNLNNTTKSSTESSDLQSDVLTLVQTSEGQVNTPSTNRPQNSTSFHQQNGPQIISTTSHNSTDHSRPSFSLLQRNRLSLYRNRFRINRNRTRTVASTPSPTPSGVRSDRQEVEKVLGLLGRIRNRARTPPAFLRRGMNNRSKKNEEALEAATSPFGEERAEAGTEEAEGDTESKDSTPKSKAGSLSEPAQNKLHEERNEDEIASADRSKLFSESGPTTTTLLTSRHEETLLNTGKSVGTGSAQDADSRSSSESETSTEPQVQPSSSSALNRRRRPDHLRRVQSSGRGKPNLLAKRLRQRQNVFSVTDGDNVSTKGGPSSPPPLPAGFLPTVAPFSIILSTLPVPFRSGLITAPPLQRNFTVSVTFPPTRRTTVRARLGVPLRNRNRQNSERTSVRKANEASRASQGGTSEDSRKSSGSRPEVPSRKVLGTSLATSVSIAVSPLEFKLRKRVTLPPSQTSADLDSNGRSDLTRSPSQVDSDVTEISTTGEFARKGSAKEPITDIVDKVRNPGREGPQTDQSSPQTAKVNPDDFIKTQIFSSTTEQNFDQFTLSAPEFGSLPPWKGEASTPSTQWDQSIHVENNHKKFRDSNDRTYKNHHQNSYSADNALQQRNEHRETLHEGGAASPTSSSSVLSSSTSYSSAHSSETTSPRNPSTPERSRLLPVPEQDAPLFTVTDQSTQPGEHGGSFPLREVPLEEVVLHEVLVEEVSEEDLQTGPLYLVSLLFVLPVVAVAAWYLKRYHLDMTSSTWQQLVPERLKSMLAPDSPHLTPPEPSIVSDNISAFLPTVQ